MTLIAFLGVPIAQADPIPIILNTSSLAGTNAVLAFDLIDGGTPGNTVTISGFSSNGTLGSFSVTGDVTGSLPGTVTFSDSQFFNEYLQNILLGSTLSFTFDATGNPADPLSFPDAFSLFLLDPATGLPLYATSDPTGANALFLYNIGGQNPLSIYSSNVTQGPNQVPEPSTAWLIGIALLVMLIVFAAAKRSSRPRLAL
ncbi:MAG: NF038129 family PEP-CTERM protein [Candidatus Moraniibacteriota bacterium]